MQADLEPLDRAIVLRFLKLLSAVCNVVFLTLYC